VNDIIVRIHSPSYILNEGKKINVAIPTKNVKSVRK